MKKKINPFWPSMAAVFIAGMIFTEVADNEFYFFASYVVLQAVIMATAWNILGGYTGYVNFGSAGFFGVGAYTAIALHILAAGAMSGLIGLGAGYLTLRIKGVYFAIATLALAIVFETIAINWEFVGGASGAYILTPEEFLFFDSYIEMLFMLILSLAIGSVVVARYLSTSRIGRGLAAIRDDEIAAECNGVPTLKLKLISTSVMGAMMGVAGAPYPFFVTYVDPASAFNLLIAINAIAMPMIGGTATWLGPVIGALVVGGMQEIITVTISSEMNLLVVGVMLVGFITLAPKGIVGLVQDYLKKRRSR
jgi:branched-chain amino acid transport system permease protein